MMILEYSGVHITPGTAAQQWHSSTIGAYKLSSKIVEAMIQSFTVVGNVKARNGPRTCAPTHHKQHQYLESAWHL